MYYVDSKKNKYTSIDNYYKHIVDGNVTSKELLYSTLQLNIIKNRKIIYQTNNVQSLYLYPLNILDYINGIFTYNSIMFHLLKINNTDYIKFFEKIDYRYFKNIEILIKNYSNDEMMDIIELSKYLKNHGVYISYNIKNLNHDNTILKQLGKLGDYYKIFLGNKINQEEFEKTLNNLKIIKENTSTNSVIHVKSYLNIEQVFNYEYIIKQFKNIVDIYQISKELIPLDLADNIPIKESIQNHIRNLEKNHSKNPKFISVKDISTLYYPRFILDERNYRKCYACYMKPYIYESLILPCKVNNIMKNKEQWKISNLSLNYNIENINKCGKICGDCASIYENDILNEIRDRLDNECICLLKVGD